MTMVADELLLDLWPGLRALPELLLELTAAVRMLEVTLPPQDNTAVLAALYGIDGLLQTIAAHEAVEAVQPYDSGRWDELLDEVRKLAKKSSAGQQIAGVSVGFPQEQLDVIDRLGAVTQTRLDYDTRTDSNPVYVGKAAKTALTSAAVWTLQKLTYDSSNRTTRVQVQEGVSWDARTAGW